jgi:hypothetical protein
VFPVSAAILDRIDDYRQVLESYSRRLLPLIEWEPTPEFNVRVLNDTGDFYRYFDATPHAEFLYACVQKTIDEDLPAETRFLQRYDDFRRQVEAFLDMPERLIDLLFRFLSQNDGRLSQRARAQEFSELTGAEAQPVEATYSRSWRHSPRACRPASGSPRRYTAGPSRPNGRDRSSKSGATQWLGRAKLRFHDLLIASQQILIRIKSGCQVVSYVKQVICSNKPSRISTKVRNERGRDRRGHFSAGRASI